LAPFYPQTHLELDQICLKYTGRKFHKKSKGLNPIKIGLPHTKKKKRRKKSFLTVLGLLFLLCISDEQKRSKSS